MLAAALLTGACAAGPQGSPSYLEGHRNGCIHGTQDVAAFHNRIPPPRDDRRYAADADYRKGWDEGYRECFDLWLVRPMNEGPEPQF